VKILLNCQAAKGTDGLASIVFMQSQIAEVAQANTAFTER
jgi:hypothetical protein